MYANNPNIECLNCRYFTQESEMEIGGGVVRLGTCRLKEAPTDEFNYCSEFETSDEEID